MGKPMVLVIHGMGTHKPGENKKLVIDGLNNAAKNFNMENFDIENEVEFFQFNYSDFLDELRLKDAEQAGKIVKHVQALKGHGLGENTAKELTTFLSQLDQNKNFNTHWLDVIYYGLMFWGEKIRIDLAKTLNNLMIERKLNNRKLHIVSHSLGTAVLHDTLAKIYRKDADLKSKVPQLDVSRFTIDSVWTVANVSRLLNLLNDIADPNHSIVNSDTGGCTNFLYNVRNEFDPFTWIKKYNRPITHGAHIDIKTVRKTNTHDLQEYMEAPLCAWHFFDRVLRKQVSLEDYNQGVQKHAATLINASYEQIKQAFGDLNLIDDTRLGHLNAIEELIRLVDNSNQTLKQLVEPNQH